MFLHILDFDTAKSRHLQIFHKGPCNNLHHEKGHIFVYKAIQTCKSRHYSLHSLHILAVRIEEKKLILLPHHHLTATKTAQYQVMFDHSYCLKRLLNIYRYSIHLYTFSYYVIMFLAYIYTYLLAKMNVRRNYG